MQLTSSSSTQFFCWLMIIIQKLVSSDGAIAFSAAAHQPVTHLARDNHNPPGGSALSHRHQGRL